MTRTLIIAALTLPIGLLIAITARALSRRTNPAAANAVIFNAFRAVMSALVAAAILSLGVTGQASWAAAIGFAAVPALLGFWFARCAMAAARHLRDP